MRLDSEQLVVETFPTTPADPGEQEPQAETFWASTGFCCDTNRDCSTACRQPTNICEVCG